MKPLIFLDIDGVLNRHGYNALVDVESSTLEPEAVARLNRIIRESDAEIVLSSAWRYMVLNGAMTLKGFEYLLRTHGVAAKDRLIATTVSDEEIFNRGQQIIAWLNANGWNRPYVVLDDGGSTEPDNWSDMGIDDAKLSVVWCDGEKGLEDDHVERALAVLNGRCQECLGHATCGVCGGSGGADPRWCPMCNGDGCCTYCKSHPDTK